MGGEAAGPTPEARASRCCSGRWCRGPSPGQRWPAGARSTARPHGGVRQQHPARLVNAASADGRCAGRSGVRGPGRGRSVHGTASPSPAPSLRSLSLPQSGARPKHARTGSCLRSAGRERARDRRLTSGHATRRTWAALQQHPNSDSRVERSAASGAPAPAPQVSPSSRTAPSAAALHRGPSAFVRGGAWPASRWTASASSAGCRAFSSRAADDAVAHTTACSAARASPGQRSPCARRGRRVFLAVADHASILCVLAAQARGDRPAAPPAQRRPRGVRVRPAADRGPAGPRPGVRARSHGRREKPERGPRFSRSSCACTWPASSATALPTPGWRGAAGGERGRRSAGRSSISCALVTFSRSLRKPAASSASPAAEAASRVRRTFRAGEWGGGHRPSSSPPPDGAESDARPCARPRAVRGSTRAPPLPCAVPGPGTRRGCDLNPPGPTTPEDRTAPGRGACARTAPSRPPSP